jgi:hypothetical protein
MKSWMACALGALTLVRPAAAQTARSANPSVERTPATRSRDEIPADAPAYARQGMWFSAGLGAGAASLHCRICQGEQETRGTAGYLRVGTTVNRRLLVGAEMNGWMRSGQTGNQRVVALTGNGYWYPNPRHGYYLKGGFGVSRYKQWTHDQNDDDVTTGLSTSGLAAQVGAGYETRVNPKMSFVPYVNLVGTAKGTMSTLRDDGTRFERNKLATGANLLLLQIGLGMTWH